MHSMMYTVSLELGSTSQRPDLCFCLFCYIECKYARIEGHRHQKMRLGIERGLGMEDQLGMKKDQKWK